MINPIPFSVIIPCGGVGKRMEAAIPKQYLLLQNKPIIIHCLEVFLSMPEVEEIVVVCEVEFHSIFAAYKTNKKLSFALPGSTRQESVFNGMQQIKSQSLVCVHDAARPIISPLIIRKVAKAAKEFGAAVIGFPVKSTIKICNKDFMVAETPERARLWEVQTPQFIEYDLFKCAYAFAKANNFVATDDVSLVEYLGKPVKIVEGPYSNIKITTPDDLIIAEKLLERACTVIN